MNPILLSFLCGAAFIGGAVATTFLVIFARSSEAKKSNDKLFGYWEKSIELHGRQLEVIARIAATLEERNLPPKSPNWQPAIRAPKS